MKADFNSILIFTDGACSGNPGPGGWGSVLVYPEGRVKELGGKESPTTNNRMEILSSIRALQILTPPIETPIVVYTDSTYLIRGITQWIWAWRSRGWLSAEGKEVQNRDLWEELSRQVMRLKPAKIDWKYVRGHTGVPGNERCDEIAVAFTHGKWANLYDGPLLGYGLAIHDLPDEKELPAMRPKEKKTPAYSYLSSLGGVVMRHQTWPECERRVKGQSSAKFKKAKSADDELEILKGWGLSPSATLIKD